MKKKTIYICGKVTGEDYQKCFDKFLAVSTFLTSIGYNVINPLLVVPRCTLWIDAMDKLKPHFIKSDIALFLPDWKSSKGASLERDWAQAYSIQIIDYENVFSQLLDPLKYVA